MPGTTEAARDQNRRVEFVIIGRTGAETRSGEELSVPPTPAPDEAPTPDDDTAPDPGVIQD